MYHSFWKYITAIAFLALMNIFLYAKIYSGGDELLLKKKREIIWQVVQEQIISKSKNHLEVFKELEEKCPLLQHANYRLLAGAPPKAKKLLTVGISSVQRSHRSYLLDTLRSLFQASSFPDLETMVVVVHLSDHDPAWLSQTVANISGLFASHIEAHGLLVVQGLLGGSPLQKENSSSPCGELYSRQKVDYALLMNFASKLSEYFLLMEDNVQYTPSFVSTIYWALSAWKEFPWVILEFSSLRFSGKVFHSSDLPCLISFFLLFPMDPPTHLLLSNFSFLAGQSAPISLVFNLFHSWGNHFTSEDTCYQDEEEEKELDTPPKNPPAVIYTNMFLKHNYPPENAYVLSSGFFQTSFLLAGQEYTVVFHQTYKVIQIEILTGFGIRGIYRLEHGQVELGYEPVLNEKGCARYTPLGPLVKGRFHQKVYYDEDLEEKVRCVRMLVTAPQESLACITQIHIWI